MVLLTGFSSGLPLALTGSTLQAWMKNEGVDLGTIGMFSLVGLPYTLKFLWAPLMDRFQLPILGRRRGWMLLTLIALMAAVAALGTLDPKTNLLGVVCVAFLITFLSASQDIAIDAYRTELLTSEQRGAGSSVSNLGYRLAMLTSGALALILADHLPWNQVYLLMAAFHTIGIVAVLLSPEPAVVETKTTLAPGTSHWRQLGNSYLEPLKQFFSRCGAIEILIFVLIYKLDIVLAVALTTPFMLELGFSKTEIGAVTKGVGLFAGIIGSLAGGAWYAKLGLKKSLWIFGIVQGLSTLSFSVLAVVGKDNTVMAAVVGFENFCAGLATAPFIAFLMCLCDKRFTATQYALLSSFAAVTRVIAGAPTGFIAKALGWPWFFVFCAFTAIPGLVLIYFRFDDWKVENAKPN